MHILLMQYYFLHVSIKYISILIVHTHMDKQYNLRSTKRDSIQIPVQVLCSDSEFSSKIGGFIKNKQQVTSSEDSDSSSDLDCSGLKADSDNETKNVRYSKSNFSTDLDQASTSDTQALFNKQILDQLTKLGDRLDVLEKNGSKKSMDRAKIKSTTGKSKRREQSPTPHITVSVASDKKYDTLPQLDALRQDAQVQQQVQERLLELNEIATSGMPLKLKSQRGGGVDVFVRRRVRWPQEFVLSGIQKERISYDQLTISQWMAGFCRSMREEKNSKMRDHMIDYLISLLDDSQDFSWSASKASHAVLLCRMEQGEIEDYSKIDQIDRVRRAHAQRHTQNVPQKSSTSDKKFVHKQQKSMPCVYFNQNTCSFSKTHETKGILYRHVCSSCFSTAGKNFPHMEIECRQKNKHTKNE